jgi:hypothetical protein
MDELGAAMIRLGLVRTLLTGALCGRTANEQQFGAEAAKNASRAYHPMVLASPARGLPVVRHVVLLVSGDRTTSTECGANRVRARAIAETVNGCFLGTSRGEFLFNKRLQLRRKLDLHDVCSCVG